MTTYEKSNADSIKALFNSIAKRYDVANGMLSFQMHKRWNRQLVDLAVKPYRPQSYLDLCCGTGAIAYNYLAQATHQPTVYMLDFSEEMLAFAKQRAAALSTRTADTHYLQADAQNIPLADASIACATIAYGIRNVTSPEKCIKDVFRVLQPGGSFGILELTIPNHKLLRFGHRLYLRTMLPIIGKVLTSNQEAYQYLCNSINTFIAPQALKGLMQEAGFGNVHIHPLCGGIATILVGQKLY